MVKRNNKPSPSIHGLVVKPINSGHDRSIRPKLMKTSTLPNPSRPSGGNPMLLKSFSIDKGTGSKMGFRLSTLELDKGSTDRSVLVSRSQI